jgi:two-component system phosphate regulon response regulator PhoB
MNTILIIEDDFDIAFLIQTQLETAGYLATTCHDGQAAIDLINKQTFDLYIVDRLLPGKNGLEICRHLRQISHLKESPIILLTALDQNEDIIQGLDAGADDYITKPFEMNVLHARVRALMRRHQRTNFDTIKYQDLEITPHKYDLKINQEKIHLTATEWQILSTLIQKPGHVFTREELINKIQGPHIHVTERTMDTHIAGLRKKLQNHAGVIETIRGFGYRFKDLP